MSGNDRKQRACLLLLGARRAKPGEPCWGEEVDIDGHCRPDNEGTDLNRADYLILTFATQAWAHREDR